MKIGILTFVNTSNYGAALQAYALQSYIRDTGNSCDIIRYDCPDVSSAHDPKALWKRKGIKNKLKAPLLQSVYQKRLDAFRAFENSYCSFSEPCNRNNVAEIICQYDRIIVGSDQVWNPDINGKDNTFFLDFLDDNSKKCSYAASIGKNYFSQEEAAAYEKLLRQFSVISAREQGTAEQLAAALNRTDVTCDIDPTLLYDGDWKKFIKQDNPNGDYIFLYLLPNNPTLFKAIRVFAAAHGCRTILLQKGMGKKKGCQIVNVASPIDFLNYVYHAKYVISGSFHALCFSLIYEKEFYATPSVQAERSVRLTDLLSTVEITGHQITAPTYEIRTTPTDFARVRDILVRQRFSSRKTIERILKL